MKRPLWLVPLCLALAVGLALAGSHVKLYTIDGNSAGDRLGFWVSFAGDVNKDGYDDFVVGAYWDDDGGTNAGSARVYSGKDKSVLYRLDGDAAGDEFGRSVRAAGDVNKDGYADFVIGAPLNDDNGTDAGVAIVFSGRNAAVLHRFEGDSAGDRFGFDVSGAGDVNDDGYDDVIVGAYFNDKNGTDAGMARVLSGKDGETLHTFYGDSINDRFGVAVSGAGDVNGDGHADLVVGAYFDDDQGADSGSGRIFSGKDGAILKTVYGIAANDQCGRAVSDAGDVNGDGYDDVVVAAYYDDTNGANAGAVRVYSGKDWTTLYTFYGDAADDRLGRAVSAAGDVNGDGVPDIFAGAVRDDKPVLNAGSARVFSGADGEILDTFYGEGVDDRFGVTVSGGGDVNGDGLADLIVGAQLNDGNGADSGRAYVYVSPAPGGALSINSGEDGTNDPSVTLSLSWQAAPSGGDVEDMRLRNAGDDWDGWIPVASTVPWTLPPGEGMKTVEVQFRDDVGATSGTLSDSIILDQTPPTGTLQVNQGYDLTASVFVVLNLDYEDLQSEVVLMRFRNEGEGWSGWIDAAPEQEWTLSGEGGTKTVEGEFRDAAGNVSDIVSDSIEFKADLALPTIDSLRVNEDSAYICPGEVLEFAVYCRDNPGGSGTDAFKVSYDAGDTWTDWYTFKFGPISKVERPEVSGLINATVVVRDRARNESEPKEATFYILEKESPYMGAGAKSAGSISAKEDVDAYAFDLVAGDLLSVKLKAKSAAKGSSLDLDLDLVRPDGTQLFEGRFPEDARKVSVVRFEVPETGRYLLVVRRNRASESERGTYKLTAKVKQAKENKKAKGESTGIEIRFDAVEGSTFKASLKADGLDPLTVILVGPNGPVLFEPKGKTGKVGIPSVVLEAGTGTYSILFASALAVTAKWSVKLPKIKGVVPE